MESWWLLLAILSGAVMATTVFFDNYIVDVVFKGKSPLSQKVVYAILEVIAAIIIIAFFEIDPLEPKQFIFIILSGACYALALIPYYQALKYDNAMVSEIFTQAQPIFVLILGLVFLKDTLSLEQFAAFFLILGAGFITIFGKKKREKKTSIKAATWIFVAITIWAFSDLFIAMSGEEASYITMVFYLLVGRGIIDVLFMIFRKREREYCFKMLKKSGVKSWGTIIADFVIEMGADAAYCSTLLFAPIALASVANTSAELISVFIFGLIFTAIWPKFGREKNTKRNVLVHLIATVILVIGIVLIG